MAINAKIRIDEPVSENDGKAPPDLVQAGLPEAPTLLDWLLHCVRTASLGRIQATQMGIVRDPEPTEQILKRADLTRKLEGARESGLVELDDKEQELVDKCLVAALSPRYAIAIINAMRDAQTVEH